MGVSSSAGNAVPSSTQERKIDPNRRLRVGLAMLSGGAFYENIIFVLFMIEIRTFLGLAIFIPALICSALAFIYVIVILVYLFKGRQDGSFMYPLTIFGTIQAIMITVLRIYVLILSIRFSQSSTNTRDFFVLFAILSTLFGALVCVSQTIIQFFLLRKDLALTVSRID
jgi:hypothetical protein